MNTQPLDDNNLDPREHSGFRAHSELAGGSSSGPSVPSPVPAGTGCEHQTLTLFSSGMHRCTNCLEALVVSSGRDEAAKFQAETLTTSFLSERLRHRPLPLSHCDRCGRARGEAVLVTGDSREWLCRRCLNGNPDPTPHFGGGTLRWPVAAVVSSSPAIPAWDVGVVPEGVVSYSAPPATPEGGREA